MSADSVISEIENILREVEEASKKNRYEKPYAWGVLYVGPSKDGAAKNCMNCALWVTSQNCIVHGRDQVIGPDMVCGHHVAGRPRAEWLQLEGIEPVDPKTSGLEKAENGSACESCGFFLPGTEFGGGCSGVIDEKASDLKVSPKGCCSRWEKK